MSDSHVLAVRDLHTVVRTGTGPLEILRGVDLEVARGETLAVVGESGSGKSFTALSIAGLLPAGATVSSGEVLLDGRDLVPLGEAERRSVRGGQIGMVYQDPMTSLNPVMRIGAQVIEGLRAHDWSKDDAHQRAVEVLGEVGLPSPTKLMRLYPHQLSGGMRQRVLIACAIAPRPKVLIADEPTTALDVTIQQQILELVASLRDEYGLAVVWITHDLGVVARIADRVAVMYAGRIAELAPTRTLFAGPQHPYTDGLLRSLPTPADPHQAAAAADRRHADLARGADARLPVRAALRATHGSLHRRGTATSRPRCIAGRLLGAARALGRAAEAGVRACLANARSRSATS